MTGAADAGWALVNGLLDDATASQGGPPLRRFVVPLQELNTAGNWIEASAMRGTGSHAVASPPGGVFVPEERCLALGAPLLIDRPLYRIPTPIVFVGSAPSICLGTLRRAIDATVNLARGKRSRLDGQPHGEQVRVQQAIVNADADQRCLFAGYREVLEEIWQRLEASEPLDAATRARFWSTLFLVVDRCREHVSNLFAVATSAAYSTRNPIERALRDLHAASAALESFQGARWSAAQVMMGNDPRHPMF